MNFVFINLLTPRFPTSEDTHAHTVLEHPKLMPPYFLPGHTSLPPSTMSVSKVFEEVGRRGEERKFLMAPMREEMDSD